MVYCGPAQCPIRTQRIALVRYRMRHWCGYQHLTNAVRWLQIIVPDAVRWLQINLLRCIRLEQEVHLEQQLSDALLGRYKR